MLFDTHCHLNYHNDEELTHIIKNAKDFGLQYIMHAGARPDEIDRQIDICNKFSDSELTIRCGFACHPEEVQKFGVITVEELKNIATKDKNIIAIGETGLDTHVPENEFFLNEQIKSFENHIATALELNLPIIIHSRAEQAVARAVEMIQFYAKERNFRAVLHSYTGDIENAKRALDCGVYISFNGIATFKNAHDVREIAKLVPRDLMLVETDAPFLSPVPVRGKPCETGFVYHTAKFLSQFLEIDFETFCAKTTENGRRLFSV